MVEIVISVVGEVAAKVAGCLLDPITRQLGYLFNYHRNIRDLNQQIDDLHLKRERLQRSVEEANRQGDEINRDVQEWLSYAEGIFQRREDFNEDEKQASKSCFYLKSRYQLSKQAKNQAADIVDKIQKAHNFDGRVSYRPHPPSTLFISSASLKDYEAFQSRESTFNQIMEALRNDDMSMIGVWGMGGVGKTTLVKQVAKQAEEHEPFHKVVMVLNISQSPNIAEIQGKIARMLGLKFEVEEDRAGRLRQRLKKEEKILVILDDIWKKLELGEIGIPYGDDHKGCKVVLTSRERRVLSKDMRTQKEFHLQHLSEDEAWNLFKKTAGDCVEKQREELLPIAVDVAKECGGLPVAIVTIANALRDEKVPVWKNALEELKTGAPTSIRGVDEKVYACLQLSYNHLKGDEVKSLFLLCALMRDGDISMDRLLQYAMGLNLFKGLYSWDKAANKLITLVENLKASSLLLDGENGDDEKSLFFDESTVLRMHDVVGDVARSIVSKDPHQFVVKEVVGLQEEWQWMDECRNCSRISLKCKNIDELPQGLVCPKLEFFLLDSNKHDDHRLYNHSYLKIPDAFLQDTKQLRVLDLSKVSLASSPSSLGFLSNLRTLCLNRCVLQDIAVIGDLKRLQVLSLAESKIEQLPKEMMQLSDLRVLDLRDCYRLKVIPRNVISSLSRLEYLSMEGCCDFKWEKEGFNSGERINNACVSELKHLSCLRTLKVEVLDPSLLPEDDVLFDNLNLTRYSIAIGTDDYWIKNREYKASRRLMLNEVKRLHTVKRFSKLLKRSQVLHLRSLNDAKDVVYEFKEGFVELKYLHISKCRSIQYIFHFSTSVEWAPPPNTFCMLEKLYLSDLSNLEALCDGLISMVFFGNLRILSLEQCERLKYVFSLPTQHDGRGLAFPQLHELTLDTLPEVISFYLIGRSSGNEESVTFFNQQITFPSLEILIVRNLENVSALCHNQLSADSFPKLRELKIRSCSKLLNIFLSNNLKGLQSLQILEIFDCDALEEIFDLDGFLELKRLTISQCRSIQYILHSSTSVEWAPPPNTFCMLEKLELIGLDNLEAVCDGPIPMGFFGNLRILSLKYCEKLKYVFSLPSTQHGRESLAFPQLQELKLENLPEVISFYSIGRSSDSEQSVTFFNQQTTFPSLEILTVADLGNVRALCHNQLSTDSFPKLRELNIRYCNKLLNIFPSNNLKGLQSLQILTISRCRSFQYILHSSASVEWTPPPLPEHLEIKMLDNLEAVCDGPIPMGFFGNLRILSLEQCERLKYVFSLPTQHDGRELAFPQLQELKLVNLPEVISFYSIGRSSGSEESVTFFNQQVSFPALESLSVHKLDNVRSLWHNQLPADSFSKLKKLNISFCNKLLNVFPPFVAKTLVQLEDLEIKSCGVLEAIVANENEDEDEDEARLQVLFPELTSLSLNTLPQLKRFCSGMFILRWPLLKKLEVYKCDKVEIFFQEIGWEGELGNKTQQSLFLIEKVTFPSLEFLTVFRLDNVRALWHNQLSAYSFPKLRQLNIMGCDKLLNIFPSNNLKGLQSLQILQIHNCDALEEIFDLDGFLELKSLTIGWCRSIQYIFHFSTSVEWAPPPNTFCMLVKLYLSDLSNLEAVCDGPISMGFFDNLRFLSLEQCERLKYVFSLPTQHDGRELAFPQLQKLELKDLPEVISFYSIGRSSGSKESMTFFNQQVSFPALESLSVHELDNVRSLWHNQLPADSFSKLKKLEISSCNKLPNVFPLSMAKALVQLEDLKIKSCGVLEAIVANENEGDEPTNNEIDFTRLERLVLDCLPNLKSFCSARYTFRFPSLEAMSMVECPKMEFFYEGVLDTPRLKGVQMTYYHKECWEGDLNATIHKKFIDQEEMCVIQEESTQEGINPLTNLEITQRVLRERFLRPQCSSVTTSSNIETT